MSEPMTMMAMAGFGLAALGILLFAALKGWQGWLDLKRLELASAAGPGGEPRRDGRADRGRRPQGADPQAGEPRRLHRSVRLRPPPGREAQGWVVERSETSLTGVSAAFSGLTPGPSLAGRGDVNPASAAPPSRPAATRKMSPKSSRRGPPAGRRRAARRSPARCCCGRRSAPVPASAFTSRDQAGRVARII